MTIDEAIEVFEADTYETILNLSELRSDELAKWLTELKAYRCYKDLYEQGRADAIEEYKNKLKTDICVRSQNSYKDIFNDREREIFNFAIKTFLDALDYFAEQLKGQNK